MKKITIKTIMIFVIKFMKNEKKELQKLKLQYYETTRRNKKKEY
jgi:hypothetical protein